MHRYVCQGLGRNYPPEVVVEKMETRDRDEGWWMANWRWKMTGSSCGDGSHPIKMSSVCVCVCACLHLNKKTHFETRGANMCIFSLFMASTNTEAGAFTYIHESIFRPSAWSNCGMIYVSLWVYKQLPVPRLTFLLQCSDTRDPVSTLPSLISLPLLPLFSLSLTVPNVPITCSILKSAARSIQCDIKVVSKHCN